jgi:hypothetical protein
MATARLASIQVLWGQAVDGRAVGLAMAWPGLGPGQEQVLGLGQEQELGLGLEQELAL